MGYDYRNKCGSCVKMDIHNRSGYNCYCKKRDAYYSAKDDRICYAYEYDRYRDYKELDFEEQRNSSCYITTMVCLALQGSCQGICTFVEIHRCADLVEVVCHYFQAVLVLRKVRYLLRFAVQAGKHKCND